MFKKGSIGEENKLQCTRICIILMLTYILEVPTLRVPKFMSLCKVLNCLNFDKSYVSNLLPMFLEEEELLGCWQHITITTDAAGALILSKKSLFLDVHWDNLTSCFTHMSFLGNHCISF